MSELTHCRHDLTFSYLSTQTGVYECRICDQPRPPRPPSRLMRRWGGWLLFAAGALLAGLVTRAQS